MLGLLVAVGAGTVATYVAYRAQARLAGRVQQAALEQGLIVSVGRAEPGLFSARFHDVTVRFKEAAGVRAALSRVTLEGALFGSPRLLIDEARFVLEGDPSSVYQSLLLLPEWQGVPASWQRLSVEYAAPILGKATFEELSVERTGTAFVSRAAQVKLGPVLSRNVRLSLDKRNQLIELGLGEPEGQITPAQVGYFGSNRGASQWMFSARHQPVRPVAQALGWELDSAFDESRAVVSGSLIVPDDRSRPIRSNLEFALDRFPKPAWPEAPALLGDTAAFVASFPLPAPGASWDIQHATLSLSMFTLAGTGKVSWREKPSFSLDLSGKLTCAQLRGNLPASVYLEQVKKYIDSEPALPAAVTAARLHEEVELRLQIAMDKAPGGVREAVWHLNAGCGLAAM
jgi:hypothetical protein